MSISVQIETPVKVVKNTIEAEMHFAVVVHPNATIAGGVTETKIVGLAPNRNAAQWVIDGALLRHPLANYEIIEL